MDMYGGNPPSFHMQGMLGTTRHDEHRSDIWNYFYRSIIVFALVVKAFGDNRLFERIRDFTLEFESLSGKNYSPSNW
jgi:hypothetical protein